MQMPQAGFVLSLALFAPMARSQALDSQDGRQPAIQPEAWQLVVLANQARAAQGAGPLAWDAALAEAARLHCLRMAAEGQIAHRYGGEPSVEQRAAQAGAHFSLIEENVAVASDTALVHRGWMESPEHRANLLNPKVDQVGVAVVASGDVLYAVADYEKAVQVLTPVEVEAAVGGLIRAHGLSLLANPALARAACAMDHGLAPSSPSGPQPAFVMHWQDADLTLLPQALLDRIASGDYPQASVGGCPAQNADGSFTLYRVAVLLYRAPNRDDLKRIGKSPF
jgi:hypothetical protein